LFRFNGTTLFSPNATLTQNLNLASGSTINWDANGGILSYDTKGVLDYTNGFTAESFNTNGEGHVIINEALVNADTYGRIILRNSADTGGLTLDALEKEIRFADQSTDFVNLKIPLTFTGQHDVWTMTGNLNGSFTNSMAQWNNISATTFTSSGGITVNGTTSNLTFSGTDNSISFESGAGVLNYDALDSSLNYNEPFSADAFQLLGNDVITDTATNINIGDLENTGKDVTIRINGLDAVEYSELVGTTSRSNGWHILKIDEDNNETSASFQISSQVSGVTEEFFSVIENGTINFHDSELHNYSARTAEDITTIPLNGTQQIDFGGTASSAATFTLTDINVGGYAEILYNGATEPTVTGATKFPNTASFIPNTDMVLCIKDFNGTRKYWFVEF